MSKPLRIAIAGLGTVGTGVVKLLQAQGDLIAQRAGRKIEIVAVSARDAGRDRGVDLASYEWIKDPVDLVGLDVDVIVEMIGGSEGVARKLVDKSLKSKRSVVTANKALLAHSGYELAKLAEEQNVALKYEAAVAGGIPIIKAVREGFSANKINYLCGILNGTCNYILTVMRDTGRDFADVLAEAQAKGFAEADPSFDVDGIDAAHKLCLLSCLAFGIKPEFEKMQITGIRHITAADITHADELGYRIKLLGSARISGDKILQSMEPCLVPKRSQIGNVDGVFNAVFIEGDFVGNSLSVGRGAGEGPTASAVVADLIDIARGNNPPVFGIPTAHMKTASWATTDDNINHFYLRIVAKDEPGVLADISVLMRDHKISMEEVLQHGDDESHPVSIVIKTHKVRQGDMQKAVDAIKALPITLGEPVMMRIEQVG